MNLLERNELSYNTLNKNTSNRIKCEPLFFTSIGPDESFEFLCKTWASRDPDRLKPALLSNFTSQQLALLALLKSGKHILIPKHRETGETLIMTLYLTYEAYYNYKDIFIIVPNYNIGEEILRKIELMLGMLMNRNNYVNTYKERFTHLARHSIELRPAQHIKLITRPEEMRGYRVRIAYFSNAAFLVHGNELYNNLIPALTQRDSNQIIMSSKYNGEDNFFYPLLTTNPDGRNFTIFPMVNPEIPPKDPDNWPFV
jgi:hypothetical protein